ncbi:MAG: hypothetical protein KGI69_02485 [Patescibacteria group bacterium]|nr:hypothetical protein [Patescibacteria group bacterium]
MVEIATGAAFILSSLYGAGQANAATSTVAGQSFIGPAATSSPAATSTIQSHTNAVEEYVQSQFQDEPILIEVASCESTFRQFDKDGDVIRGQVNHGDVGVMQINEYYHAEEAKKLGYDIYTLEGNVAFAKYLYAKYGTSPWSSSEKCWSHAGSLAQK